MNQATKQLNAIHFQDPPTEIATLAVYIANMMLWLAKRMPGI